MLHRVWGACRTRAALRHFAGWADPAIRCGIANTSPSMSWLQVALHVEEANESINMYGIKKDYAWWRIDLTMAFNMI